MTVTAEDNAAEIDLAGDVLFAEDPPSEDVSAGQESAQDIPDGYVRDRDTGEIRPRKRPGRRPKPVTPPDETELAAAAPIEPEPDTAPKPPGKHRRFFAIPDGPAEEIPMPRGGVIAKGVDRLYRRAGKIIRAADYDIGQAVIECTRREDDDDQTVGEAWEAVARNNPRIRRYLLTAVSGGDWADLVMAHAPVGMAIVMKPAISRMIIPQADDKGNLQQPGIIGRAVQSFLEPDEDSADGDLLPEDAEEIASVANAQMERMADRVARSMTPQQKAAAERAMSRMAAGLSPGDDPDIPAALRRQQPKHRSRSARKGR